MSDSLSDGSQDASALGLTVHSMPSPALADDAAGGDHAAKRTAIGRRKMLLVLAVCAAPVVAAYLTYFVIRPMGRTNYSELIEPLRPIPPDLQLADLSGRPVAAASLKGQWLLVVVARAGCDTACERHLWIQRQLRETLGREKDRLDKVWLVSDAAAPRPQTLQAIETHTSMTILRAPADAIARWFEPAAGHALEDHMYVVDPLGNWMMRTPPDADPTRVKSDIQKLLRASAGWDKPGR